METQLERQRSRHEAYEIAAMLQQYVGLALETGTSVENVNAYLLEVRNFMFRQRPAALRAPRALEVVR